MAIFMRRIPGDTSKFAKKRADDTTKVEYALTGSFIRKIVEDYVLANLPYTDFHRSLDSVTVKELVDHRDGHWRIVANYKGPTLLEEEDSEDPKPDITEISVGFSVGGQSQLMTHSLETISSTMNPAETPVTAPDLQNQINVVDGKPEGVELNPSSMADSSFTVEQEIRTSLITNPWLAAVENASASVNNATFRGRPAGEVLFWGLRGTLKLAEEFSTLTWEFFVRKNQAAQTIGVFPSITKKGWEYAWIYSEERKVETVDHKLLVHAPIALYVERLFPTANLTGTGVSA